MSVSAKLELRQSQSLVMTAQLQQSIKLLQLSSLDLQEFIAEEIEKNPLLQDGGDGPSEGEERAAETSTDEMDTVDLGGRTSDEAESLLDTSSEDRWESSEWNDRVSPTNAGGGEIAENVLEQTLSENQDLHSYVLSHLYLSTADEWQRLIGRHLVDMLDEAGYLSDYHHLVELLNCKDEEIEEVVRLLQQCDPPGLCARSLSECMELQLRELDRYDPAMQVLVENLPLLANADYGRLETLCGVDREDLRDMVAELRNLNPKPGLKFTYYEPIAMPPDVMVRERSGGWQVELNPQTLPRVLVNQHYFVELSSRSRHKDEKKFLTEQLAHANWLVKALDQRAQTLLKVSSEIVRRQENFLRHGIKYLAPLTLREVADTVNLHESTVSRVTTQKYMATPRGQFELKYFFTSSVQSALGGDDVSSRTVQHFIREMIESETPENILSDEAIMKKLQDKGVDVARRTVAKYREMMGFGSSTERRRVHKRQL